jgi:hypothetical protein
MGDRSHRQQNCYFHRWTRWKLILCFVHEIHIFLFCQNSASSYIVFIHVMVYQYIYFCLSESPRCPVRSLVAYIKKLNPRCKSFFQQSRKDTKDGIYYNNVALGHNFLGSMMKKISEAAKLSSSYTNHSLRGTTVHVLDAAKFPSRHIMSVTGHKSENPLKTYSGQTSEDTKRHLIL